MEEKKTVNQLMESVKTLLDECKVSGCNALVIVSGDAESGPDQTQTVSALVGKGKSIARSVATAMEDDQQMATLITAGLIMHKLEAEKAEN